ncbi:MAG TPA: tryptophan dimethylallyltransferase family protein [Yinghuangia sp.]|nr:tryptophan dimethylallyltransferase family protein [Yinghuangia sp.]
MAAHNPDTLTQAAFPPGSGVIAEMIGRPLRFDSTRYRPTDTYAEIAGDQVWRAHESLGLNGTSRDEIRALVDELTHPWGRQPVGSPPERACWVSIDGMPFELSVAWVDGRTAVRLSLESPGDGTAHSRMRDGMALTRRLADRAGVCVDRLARIEDLFTTDAPQGYFSVSHAVAWRPDGRHQYKVYLNPAVGGREQSAHRTREAMVRLGLERPWQTLADHLGGTFDAAHEPVAVAVDLLGGDDFRAQVFTAHSGTSPEEIDAKSAVAHDHVPGLFARALREINGPHDAPAWQRKPPVTAYSLDSRHDLPGATLYIPLIPVHDNDEAARDRVAAFLRGEGSAAAKPYTDLLDALADRPLAHTLTQNFISYRGGDSPRFAVYVAPGTYRAADIPAPPRTP